MYTIENTTTVASTPAQVLQALTTKDGIKGWWTTNVDCNADKREATFRFVKPSGTNEHTFRLDSADESGVVMTCIRGSVNDWVGTKLAFKLVADGATTRIDLAHSGYHAQNELYAMCTKGWTYFIASLKSYLETGKGTPHVGVSQAA